MGYTNWSLEPFKQSQWYRNHPAFFNTIPFQFSKTIPFQLTLLESRITPNQLKIQHISVQTFFQLNYLFSQLSKSRYAISPYVMKCWWNIPISAISINIIPIHLNIQMRISKIWNFKSRILFLAILSWQPQYDGKSYLE